MAVISTAHQSPIEQGSCREINAVQYIDGYWKRLPIKLPDEMPLSLFINGQKNVSILCTPEKLNYLVIGYLRSEGFINNLDEITKMRVCLEESLADTYLTYQTPSLHDKCTMASDCCGSASFEKEESVPPLDSDWHVSPFQILSSIRLLQRKSKGRGSKNGIRKGMHMSALSNGYKLIISAGDIGRHNTIDKIWGECMLKGIPTKDCLLVTTGRISLEMLVKAAKMGIPVVASLNSATNQAVELGANLGITVVGYAHRNRLSVFSCKERLLFNDI
ncbi:formate dehydrogenase accessory sulfurtransferase FdhD [Chloroflexota bacterium]